MNTSIAPDSSNDSTDMSPALTQDNSQDVASDDVSKSAHLLAKLKSVHLSDSLAKTILRTSDDLIQASSEETENVDLSKFATTYASRKSRGLKSERSSGVVTTDHERNGNATNGNGDGVDKKETDKGIIMTPGISSVSEAFSQEEEEDAPSLPYLIEPASTSSNSVSENNGDKVKNNSDSNEDEIPINNLDTIIDCELETEKHPTTERVTVSSSNTEQKTDRCPNAEQGSTSCPTTVSEHNESSRTPSPQTAEEVPLVPAAVPAAVPTVASEQNKEASTNIPVLSDLQQQHSEMASQTADIVKRIRHLQSLVATRHTRQQLMTFVEHQHKVKLENAANPGTSSTQNSLISLTNDNSKDLNSMSTAALVELVKMHSSNNNHRGDRKIPEKRKRKHTMKLRDRKRVEDVTGVLTANLSSLHEGIDSDATASSSGGETDDEDLERFSRTVGKVNSAEPDDVDTENLRRSACWRWSRDRSRVISRWTWLQAQVSDLEFRIRQHGEIHRQLRSSKSALLPTPAPVTAAQISTQTEDLTLRAARCIPLPKLAATRHKIVRVSHAPSLGQKARRPVMVRCQCLQSVRQCAICAGHHHYAQPMDIQNLPRRDRIGQIDQGYHPVLSFSRDVNPAIELEEVVNSTEKSHASVAAVDKKMIRLNKKLLAEARKKQRMAIKLKKAKEKKERKDMNRKRKLAVAEQIANKKKRNNNKNRSRPTARRERADSEPWEAEDDEDQLEEEYEQSSLANSAPAAPGSGSDLTKSALGLSTASVNKRASQYDIDDIVIPYHIAAATRVEKLQVKEIDTPRWREFPLNGVNTVHDKFRRRSSSVSMSVPATPITPVTPAGESKIPTAPPPHIPLTVQTSSERVVTPSPASAPSEVVESFPTPVTPQSCEETTLSARSSATSLSLGTLEAEEDISDSKYMALHSELEEKEKSRYMNFVTVNRSRPRAQSTAAAASHHTNTTAAAASTSHHHHKTNNDTPTSSTTITSSETVTQSSNTITTSGTMLSPAALKQPTQTITSSDSDSIAAPVKSETVAGTVTTPLVSPAAVSSESVVQSDNSIPGAPSTAASESGSQTAMDSKSNRQSAASSHPPLTQTNSIPGGLSSSHDGAQLRDELASATRKRSCSFTTNRLKKEQSVDNSAAVSSAEKQTIQPWTIRTFPLVGDEEAALDFSWKAPPSRRDAAGLTNADRWKVISAEEEDKRNALVLKLSKAHQ